MVELGCMTLGPQNKEMCQLLADGLGPANTNDNDHMTFWGRGIIWVSVLGLSHALHLYKSRGSIKFAFTSILYNTYLHIHKKNFVRSTYVRTNK